MIHIRKVALAFVLLTGAGCVTAPPMTESEFRGFCYQSGNDYVQDCDTISVCDDYTPALSKKENLPACIKECQAINLEQRRRYLPGVCGQTIFDAEDWCERFCRTNNPN